MAEAQFDTVNRRVGIRRLAWLSGRVAAGCAAVVLLGAAALSGPDELLGRSSEPGAAMPADPARAAIVTALASLVRDSHRVLAVHQRGASPYVELVLWLQDERQPGTLNADELVVLCHSQVLQAITTFTLSPDRADRTSKLTLAMAIDPATASTPGFCDQWRSDPAVEPRVLAGGISDLEIDLKPMQPLRSSSPIHPSPAQVRLTLTWPAEMADSPGQASVVVDAMTGPDRLQ